MLTFQKFAFVCLVAVGHLIVSVYTLRTNSSIDHQQFGNNLESAVNAVSPSLVDWLAGKSARSAPSLNSTTATAINPYHVQVTAIHIDKAEFPLSELLFRLTLELALEATQRRLDQRQVKLSLSVRTGNTCSRQYAGALAAEEYYLRRSRLFIVSGCDDAIRSVSRLASNWRVPVMTAAGFGADLNDKSVYKTLVRVAFSLRTAVDFLGKILKSFKWRRVNLIVDESDANSLALRKGIEKQLSSEDFTGGAASAVKSNMTTTTSAVKANDEKFQVNLNVISLDLQSLITQTTSDEQSSSDAAALIAGATTTSQPARQKAATNVSLTTNNVRSIGSSNLEDKWPNELVDTAIRDALTQSSMFSRVNILLIPQMYLRKFMLSAYDRNMANGLYTFINMPLLLMNTDDESVSAGQASSSTSSSSSGSGSSALVNSRTFTNASQKQQQGYTTTTGDNVFVWRSSSSSSRNAHAKQAFESLMSIYLRIPTSKAYVYFASRLSNLANNDQHSTITTMHKTTLSKDSKESQTMSTGTKIQLTINPYSASFYDCLQIYSIALDESLAAIEKESNREARRKSKVNLHEQISNLVRNRRFDNMVTGTISINDNGDRETDYTLDDMNQMTGKYAPVILFKGESKDIERLGRISWSSDDSVGPTIDNVECHLSGTCASKPLSRFLVTLMVLAVPLALVMGSALYFIYNHISLESQLVDYWWKINYRDIEIVQTRRKNAGDGSSIVTGAGAESQVSSHPGQLHKGTESSLDPYDKSRPAVRSSELGRTTTITKVTDTSAAFASSAADVCYGNITLGVYKLTKVAIKPISKFHQSRKLMIELRTIKTINHNNLCRFVGIVVDEPNTALVSEFCPKGSLREFFQNESMVIDWTFKYSIINDIIAGLLYLHSSPLEFHGRLKSSNCLVSSRFVVKLSDYGLRSIHEQSDEDEDDLVLMGKQICLAPEHLKTSSSKNCSKKGDVYSFGMLLYEIITNRIPFYNTEKNDYIIPLKELWSELKNNGPSDKIGPDMSVIDSTENNIDVIVDFMKQCWRYDANQRPSLLVVGTALKRITRGVTSKKLLENLTNRMEQYTNNLESLVDAKLATLVEEKLKTEELLYQFVPRSIASLLKEGQTVEPEAFDCVTVFYSDIVGFTSLSSESSPMEVIDFLSDLYLCFDETLEHYDIFKVDTIGDAYIVASGLPQRNEGKHVVEIARAALELCSRLANFKIPHKPGRSLQMRVGIHSGPCIAGIVGGLNMPKYCVFGDTLTTGKFMESSGQPMKIHITQESKNLLEDIGGFKIEPRVPKVNKDGLPFQTYWLEEELN